MYLAPLGVFTSPKTSHISQSPSPSASPLQVALSIVLIADPVVGSSLDSATIKASSDFPPSRVRTVSPTDTRRWLIDGSFIVSLKTTNSVFLKTPELAVVSSSVTEKNVPVLTLLTETSTVCLVNSLLLASGLVSSMIPGWLITYSSG